MNSIGLARGSFRAGIGVLKLCQAIDGKKKQHAGQARLDQMTITGYLLPSTLQMLTFSNDYKVVTFTPG